MSLIASKTQNVELILTGGKADSCIIEAADLVTGMVESKHYYNEGIEVREGIEK